MEAEAAALLVKGDEANDLGDKYVLNTVFLAAVMFSAAVAQDFDWLAARLALLGVGFLMLIVELVNLIRYPVA